MKLICPNCHTLVIADKLGKFTAKIKEHTIASRTCEGTGKEVVII